jgi:pyridoxal phosphate enzyme (YggS family)
MIAENIQHIQDRISSACLRAGRSPSEVTLIAVTKTFGVPFVLEAIRAGVSDFGENYIQELRDKQTAVAGSSVRWHFIGHLQTNKIKYIVPWIHMVHSVDSVRLGNELDRAARKESRTIGVMVEVNTSGEASKEGVSPGAAGALVEELRGCSGIRVDGLMTIGPFLPDPDDSRPSFKALRLLRDAIATPDRPLPYLSMGMTNDFEVAIEEGATHVRIGTAIFGKRPKKHE